MSASVQSAACANILVVGIGGQGVMTASELVARAALAAGLDACKSEIAGMSQRGGVVSSQLRVGTRIVASEITPGQVDLLVALEAAEGLRWSHWLAPSGRLVVNTLRVEPPVVSAGIARYPDDPWRDLGLPAERARRIDAGEAAQALGDVRLANSVMLGAAADWLPFAAALLRNELLARFNRSEDLRQRNAQAFARGQALAVPAAFDRACDVAPTAVAATG